jgi:hypothetical protein
MESEMKFWPGPLIRQNFILSLQTDFLFGGSGMAFGGKRALESKSDPD